MGACLIGAFFGVQCRVLDSLGGRFKGVSSTSYPMDLWECYKWNETHFDAPRQVMRSVPQEGRRPPINGAICGRGFDNCVAASCLTPQFKYELTG